MNDPYRERHRAKRFWRMFFLWGVVPWWKVPPEDRVTMWEVFRFRWEIGAIIVAAIAGIVLLVRPMAFVFEHLTTLGGTAAEKNPGPYLLLAIVLTVVGPPAVVGFVWYAIRRRARRKRGLAVDHPDHRPLV